MMRFTLFILLVLFGISSCDINSYKESNGNTIEAKKLPSTSASTLSDTLIVNEVAAIITEPDSLQIERRKKNVGEEDFYIGADDYLYYLNQSHNFLYSVKVNTIVAKDKKFILFVGSDKSHHLIKTDTLSELWNIFFFDPKKKMKKIDMTAIEDEYKRYFIAVAGVITCNSKD